MPTALITGSNRGIGLEFVRQYAEAGWNVIACCRAPHKADALQKLAQQHHKLQLEMLDVGDFNAITILAKKLKDAAIDLLINNAGILTGGTIHTTAVQGDTTQILPTIDGEAWSKVLHVNTIAPALLTQALLPNLEHGTNSKIVMLSSGWGSIENMESPSFIAYRSSKAALNVAMRNIALALRPKKIICVSMSPGWVSTDMGGQGAVT